MSYAISIKVPNEKVTKHKTFIILEAYYSSFSSTVEFSAKTIELDCFVLSFNIKIFDGSGF